MPDTRDEQLQEVAILTRAVENVFRKLIRFLVGRMSLVKLQEMVRILYIQEAEEFIRAEDHLEHVSMTKLGVLTGLDTRALSTVINSPAYRNPVHRENNFLKELTPAASIVEVWASEEPYFNSKKNKANSLHISGSEPSFESLVNSTIKGRGITASSLLQRLEASGALRINNNSNTVDLIQTSYLPRDVNDHIGFIELGLSAVGNLIDTVDYNLKAIQQGKERLFQRGAWSLHLPVDQQETAKLKLRELLSSTEKEARDILIRLEKKPTSGKRMTSGVSFFYFEENS